VLLVGHLERLALTGWPIHSIRTSRGQSSVNPVCYRVINHNYTIANAFCRQRTQYPFEETV
jgi:hypothetical protein